MTSLIEFLIGTAFGASLATSVPGAIQSIQRATSAIRLAKDAQDEAASGKPRLYVLPRDEDRGGAA